MPDRLDLATFQPCVGQKFDVDVSGKTLELTLTEATPGRWQPEGETTFAFELMFRGPQQPILPQAIYRMTNESLGPLDLFIVPLKNEPEGTAYQAVFS